MRRWSSDESGFAITTLLLLVSVATSVIVGGSSTYAAVQNHADIVEASDRMYQVSEDIKERTAGDDSPRAQALRDYAEQMRSTSVAMNMAANKDVYTNVRNNVGDIVLTPLQGGAAITAAKFAWDFKTGYELGDTAMNAWGVTDPGADAVLQDLKGMKLARDYDSPVEQAIVEAKLRGTKIAVTDMDPGLSPDEVEALAKLVVGDMEAAGNTGNGTGDDFNNGFYADLGAYLGWDVPSGAAVGDVGGDDEGLYDDGEGYVDETPTGGVPEGLTGVNWDVEAVCWDCGGPIDPRDAPSMALDPNDLRGADNQRLQYSFRQDGTIGHRHVFWGGGAYTYSDGVGEITFDDEVEGGRVTGATFYFDESANALYIVEAYIETYTGETLYRALKMTRGY